MRSAFIHVGMPKTGTTAIQKALDKHRDGLAENGLFNPKTLHLNHPGLIAKFHPLGTRHFFFKGSSITPEEGERQSARLWSQVQNSSQDIVVSSEYLYSAHKNYSLMVAEFLDAGLTPVFICYVRHPVDAAISSAQQSVKKGERTISEVLKNPRWNSPVLTLKAAKATGQKVVVRDFAGAKSIGVVHDFISTIGYGRLNELFTETRENQSLSMEGAVIAEIRETYRKRFGREPFPKSVAFDALGTPFTLPEKSKEDVRKNSVDEIEFIAREFGIDLKETSEPHPFRPRLSNDSVVELLKAMRVFA